MYHFKNKNKDNILFMEDDTNQRQNPVRPIIIE